MRPNRASRASEANAIETVVAVQVEAATAGKHQFGTLSHFALVLMARVWRTDRGSAGPNSSIRIGAGFQPFREYRSLAEAARRDERQRERTQRQKQREKEQRRVERAAERQKWAREGATDADLEEMVPGPQSGQIAELS
jgi:hypothetical protein